MIRARVRLRLYASLFAVALVTAAGALVLRAANVPDPTPPHPITIKPATIPAAGQNAYDWAKWRRFWSFQPVRPQTPPAVKNQTWVRNPIDPFVLAKLESAGLNPAPEADKLTLLRRATFDLTGLPPTAEEIRGFLADKSPDAYEKLIDRLLASPYYGERWGRHWLDVARYVPGRINFPGVKNTAGDQSYRDYVVRAFNKDKPYDRFVTEQLAGDLLPAGKDRDEEFDRLTAPAFLSIGAWFDMCTDPNQLRLEMVDEMINTTTKALLGLSVSCARCHDHKFDPIPAADYYALGGIFRSTRIVGEFSEYWRDGRERLLRPLAMPDEVAANDRVESAIKAKKADRWKYLSQRHEGLLASWKADEAKYREVAAMMPAADVRVIEAENFDGVANLRIAQISRDGVATDVIETLNPVLQWAKYRIEVPETAQYRLEALYSAGDKSPVTVQVNGDDVAKGALAGPTGGWEPIYQRWESAGTFELRKGLNFLRITTPSGNFPRLDRFRLYRADDDWDARVTRLAGANHLHAMVLANFVKDPANPWPTTAGMAPYLDDAGRNAVGVMDAEIEQLQGTIKPYPQIISVTDQPTPTDLPIHLRGNTYRTSKEAVPRGVPRILDEALPRPAMPAEHSGRLELARWLTDPRNPLTARVMVNRTWGWHFGRGIVATPSDFGSRGEPPTHPELLDWLAGEFVKSGWSIKHIHRLIMTSAAYRMSSRADEGALAADPQNKLLSHFDRRRLEVEPIYDAMLSTINKLPRARSGDPLDVEKTKDRAMYVLTSGRSPKGLGVDIRKMFSLFDYDMSGVPIDVRPVSNTPAQALFWLNSPVVKYYADRFAERLLKMDKLTEPKRVEMAYLLAFGRSPTKAESAKALEFLEADAAHRQEVWSQFCQALYGAAEFRYVD